MWCGAANRPSCSNPANAASGPSSASHYCVSGCCYGCASSALDDTQAWESVCSGFQVLHCAAALPWRANPHMRKTLLVVAPLLQAVHALHRSGRPRLALWPEGACLPGGMVQPGGVQAAQGFGAGGRAALRREGRPTARTPRAPGTNQLLRGAAPRVPGPAPGPDGWQTREPIKSNRSRVAWPGRRPAAGAFAECSECPPCPARPARLARPARSPRQGLPLPSGGAPQAGLPGRSSSTTFFRGAGRAAAPAHACAPAPEAACAPSPLQP